MLFSKDVTLDALPDIYQAWDWHSDYSSLWFLVAPFLAWLTSVLSA